MRIEAYHDSEIDFNPSIVSLAARRVKIVLSNGAEFVLIERQDTPDVLSIEAEETIMVYPRASNLVRLKLEN